MRSRFTTRVSKEAERRAKWLVHWLNRSGDEDRSRLRIAQLIQDLQQFESYVSADAKGIETDWRARLAVQRAIQKKMARYTVNPGFADSLPSLGGRPWGIEATFTVVSDATTPHAEWQAIEALQLLPQNFFRLAKCSCCSNWIFQRTALAKFCSRKCRQSPYEKKRAKKKSRKKYQREYHKKWRSRKSQIERAKKGQSTRVGRMDNDERL